MKESYHILFLQSAISAQKSKIFDAQKRLLKELVPYYSQNRDNRMEIIVNAGTPLVLTDTEVERLSLRSSESNLDRAARLAQSNFNSGTDLAKKLVALIDSTPSSKVVDILTQMKNTGIEVTLIVFGEVMSSSEIEKLRETFKVYLVDDVDKVPGENGEITVDVIDTIKGKIAFKI